VEAVPPPGSTASRPPSTPSWRLAFRRPPSRAFAHWRRTSAGRCGASSSMPSRFTPVERQHRPANDDPAPAPAVPEMPARRPRRVRRPIGQLRPLVRLFALRHAFPDQATARRTPLRILRRIRQRCSSPPATKTRRHEVKVLTVFVTSCFRGYTEGEIALKLLRLAPCDVEQPQRTPRPPSQ
jgi:hypothetical protein